MLATQVRSEPRQPLVDVDDVQPLNEQDQVLFSELYAVLERHGAFQRFGITLLHQHFDMADDEILLERTEKERRRQLIAPVKISSLDGQKPIETSWRLDTGKPALLCVCVVVDQFGRHEHCSNGDDD